MSEVTDKKWLQVRLEVDLWKKLAHWSVEQGCTVSELVRRVLVKECEVQVKSQQTSSGHDTSRDCDLKEVKAVRSSRGGSTPPAGPKTAPTPVSEPPKATPEEKPKVDPKTCKHYFLPGNRTCVKCGTVPAIVG